MLPLAELVATLRRLYGPPAAPPVTRPLELILFENAAYLVDDARRLAVWQRLRARVGTTPQKILAAPDPVLADAIVDGGMHPLARAAKLKRIAEIALEAFGDDLDEVLERPLPEAKRALRKFPGIGEPGAEKVLLFAGARKILALDSNGLRVLVRLGFGTEQKNYAATYRSAQGAVGDLSARPFPWLVAAHQLLRRHGQELCKASAPRCERCPLAPSCRYATAGSAAARAK